MNDRDLDNHITGHYGEDDPANEPQRPFEFIDSNDHYLQLRYKIKDGHPYYYFVRLDTREEFSIKELFEHECEMTGFPPEGEAGG